MNPNLKTAHNLFYNKEYGLAKNMFIDLNLPYEAGFCALLMKDLIEARKFFELKKNICTASNFGLIILNILEDKEKKPAAYFQIRSFLEIYLNLFIENSLFSYAQKIIDNSNFFTQVNIETPKFIARVLYANNYLRAIHKFANYAKQICFYDAEIHYIDACVYIREKKYKEANKCIEDCLSFAGEYYPILCLKEQLAKLN